MSDLKLFLLGPPRVELEEVVVDIRRRKGLALLAYLAVTGEGQRRDTLATLLWPEASQSRARASLSRDLSILNRLLAGRCLATDGEMVALWPDSQVWIDHTQFQQRLARCQNHDHLPEQLCPACLEALTEAVDLYRADFLSGFTLSGCPDFDEWQSFQTESLRRELATALERLIRAHQAQGDPATALPYARRWLSLDPLHEPAHRLLMQLYAQTGDRGAAVRQYQECVRVLEAELGVPPADETTALYERVRTEVVGPIEPVSSVPRHNLPPQPTPFVGRAEELVKITERLADPACRLLSLTGPGGIGKTRLALQAVSDLIEAPSGETQFSQGVYFASLAPVSSTDSLVATVAEALSFSFYSDVAPRQQLLDYLREKELLLLLDNFEHLLTPSEEAMDLLTDILAAAPAVKIMATSREALNLQEEWLFPIDGLPFPTDEAVEDRPTLTPLTDYSAVQLFEQCARRANPDFSPATAEGCVVRICQLVEGMPLGIELAAAWLKMFPCEHITRELEQGLEFLTTSLRNVPDRHRSMRAVFEHSWQLLSEAEQRVFRQLSVFRGGFRQEAAEQVTGATFADLVALVEKSLLRLTPSGRYQFHELLRQFAAEKLQAVPEEKEVAQNRHSDYYLAFVRQREERLKGEQQQGVLAEIGEEIENVRMAWNWAVERDKIEQVSQALDGLYDFYQIRSRYQEGEESFDRAVRHLQVKAQARGVTDEALLGKILARQGALRQLQGLTEPARRLLHASLAIARRLDEQGEIVFSLNFLGQVSWWTGEYEAAKQYTQESLALSREIGNREGITEAILALGNIATFEGEFMPAKSLVQEGLAISREIRHQDRIASYLSHLGFLTFCLGEYRAAAQYYQESFGLFQENGNQYGMGLTLGGLGLANWGLGGAKLPEAKAYAEDGVAILRYVGHQFHIATHLNILGLIIIDLGEYEAAKQYFEEDLAICRASEFTSQISMALNGLSRVSWLLGDSLSARKYLHESLEIGMKSQTFAWVLEALFGLGCHLAQAGSCGNELPSPEGASANRTEKKDAVELLNFIIHHQATLHVYKDKAACLLTELEVELPPKIFAAALERGKARKLEDVVAEILAEG